MASRKTAGAAAKKRAEAEPTLAVTPNEPVQEVTAQELDKEKEPPAAPRLFRGGCARRPLRSY
ncbi:hypothetical protein [Bifidobacterium sp. ESL0822]|uniref:hypothetical protein n=1 Tax=Bifidobacterium sp. ESL0822 TaxID=3448585 RepID=UPI00404200A3